MNSSFVGVSLCHIFIIIIILFKQELLITYFSFLSLILNIDLISIFKINIKIKVNELVLFLKII